MNIKLEKADVVSFNCKTKMTTILLSSGREETLPWKLLTLKYTIPTWLTAIYKAVNHES